MTPAFTALNKAKCFASLPAPWSKDLSATITAQRLQDPHCLVVLDDDPTGTQTVHGVPVLSNWSVETLLETLTHQSTFFILTNSRSLPESEASALVEKIGENLYYAAQQSKKRIVIASRSDSTLRGHYPSEVNTIAKVLQIDGPQLLIPFFEEGGRFTVNNTHYVQQGEALIPAAETEFARDHVFGYKRSSLPDWVEEKSGLPADQVATMSIEELRIGGPDLVTNKLIDFWKTRKTRPVMIVNSADYRDQEVFVSALLNAEAQGCRFIYRTSASFVRVRAAIAPRALLSKQELPALNNASAGGLVVVGSYVSRSSEQLSALVSLPEIYPCEAEVALLQSEPQRNLHIQALSKQIETVLNTGQHVVLFTSRALLSAQSEQDNLEIGQQVSSALCQIIRNLSIAPRFLIAKGGITSSDLAVKGLGMQQAAVIGQILPGVSVWKMGSETRFPGLNYVLFPGNVGSTDALCAIVRELGEIG